MKKGGRLAAVIRKEFEDVCVWCMCGGGSGTRAEIKQDVQYEEGDKTTLFRCEQQRRVQHVGYDAM